MLSLFKFVLVFIILLWIVLFILHSRTSKATICLDVTLDKKTKKKKTKRHAKSWKSEEEEEQCITTSKALSIGKKGISANKKTKALNLNGYNHITVSPISKSSYNCIAPKGEEIERIALLVGIDYLETPDSSLLTCFNDTVAVASWLSTKFGYQPNQFYWLTDNKKALPFTPELQLTPTQQNFNKAWQAILKKCTDNDKLNKKTEVVFLFSGHGANRSSSNWEELDGDEECFVFSDLSTLWDEQFCTQYLAKLPKSCNILILCDACHSGSVANLPWQYNFMSQALDQQSTHVNLAANIVMLSGCQDPQTSSAGRSNRDLSEFTRAFLQVASNNPDSLLLAETVLNLRRVLRLRGQSQIPSLSCSHSNDVYGTLF